MSRKFYEYISKIELKRNVLNGENPSRITHSRLSRYS